MLHIADDLQMAVAKQLHGPTTSQNELQLQLQLVSLGLCFAGQNYQ